MNSDNTDLRSVCGSGWFYEHTREGGVCHMSVGFSQLLAEISRINCATNCNVPLRRPCAFAQAHARGNVRKPMQGTHWHLMQGTNRPRKERVLKNTNKRDGLCRESTDLWKDRCIFCWEHAANSYVFVIKCIESKNDRSCIQYSQVFWIFFALFTYKISRMKKKFSGLVVFNLC